MLRIVTFETLSFIYHIILTSNVKTMLKLIIYSGLSNKYVYIYSLVKRRISHYIILEVLAKVDNP